jgi:hypothetical protein
MKLIKRSSVIILFFFIKTSSTYALGANDVGQYKVDDSAIEEMFQTSDDITFTANIAGLMLPSQEKIQDTDKQMLAGIVALASWITGIGILVPIHRLILGTGNQAGKIIALYCVTLSGCGFILLIDGIMLLIHSDESQYIENPKFIMWQ